MAARSRLSREGAGGMEEGVELAAGMGGAMRVGGDAGCVAGDTVASGLGIADGTCTGGGVDDTVLGGNVAVTGGGAGPDALWLLAAG